tara:strand:- start:2885 stop:4180 length:1296 start_codon:yes stop_codon:yes gene_type:complete
MKESAMKQENTSYDQLSTQCQKVKDSTGFLRVLSSEQKNLGLKEIAKQLLVSQDEILQANKIDLEQAHSKQLTESQLARLRLDQDRLRSMAHDVSTLADLPDPIGETIEEKILSNGLNVRRVRVPLGVVGVIYESRPNVTVDIASLCLKSSNGVLMRGGSEALNSNRALVRIIHKAVESCGITKQFLQFIDSTERNIIKEIINMDSYLDLIIPRGGSDLIHFVKEHSSIPAITGGIGVCHTYIDKDADVDKAVAIAHNAKISNPSVCNALDTLLIHTDVSDVILPKIAQSLVEAGVELRCDPKSLAILCSQNLLCKPAQDSDWGNEFLSLIASIRVVDSLEEALWHISHYGSGHSEAIVTENQNSKQQFLNEVDAAAVFANTSTRFTDGSALGLGSEVAISTSKLHARGPMGMRELTSYKWIIQGDGQIRT